MADTERGSRPETTSTPPGGAPEEDPERARRHRMAVFGGAERKLADQSVDHSLAERLAALVADAGEVYDLAESPDIYGDGVVAELERRTAEELGFPAAAFFPSGTMAQQVALRCWAARTGNPTVALHPLAHPEVHERQAFSQVSGLRTVHLTDEPRLPNAAEVLGFDEQFGTLMLELPLRDAGYVLPSWEELVAVVEAARERDAVVHFDGARLWETTPHFGRPLREIAGLADSVYVSFYKTLGGLSGAVLAGPESLIAEARTWRHRYGGQVFQQFPAALAGLLGLRKVLPEIPSYVAHAKVVAQAIGEGFAQAGVAWFRVHPEPPHTHEFQVWLPYDAEVLSAAALRQAEESGVCLFRRWLPSPSGPKGLSFTEVTVTAPGLAWTAEDVRTAVADFVRRLR